jgi:DNA-binding NtrC family response regulator
VADDIVEPAQVVADIERRTIAAALAANAGNLLRTARVLAIERNTLKRKLALYGLR